MHNADGEKDDGANVVAVQQVAIRTAEASMVNTQQHWDGKQPKTQHKVIIHVTCKLKVKHTHTL